VNEFKVEEKVNFNYSDFRTKVINKRKERLNELNKEKDNIWSDNVPDLEEEDLYEDQRLHCWVLLKGSKRGINKDIFIEPSTGTEFEIDKAP